MKNRFLKILISMVLTACMIATPVFGMQSDASVQNQDQSGIEQGSESQDPEELIEEDQNAVMGSGIEDEMTIEAAEEEGLDIFESEPEETSQDVEVKADSWRYDDGDVLEKYETLGATEVILPEEEELEAAAYGDTKDKSWTVSGKTFSGGYLRGIDVSVWQGQSSGLRSKIDWAKLNGDVQAGVLDFVIIRCGYGVNTTSRDDSEFTYNVQQCEKYGIPYGVYLYSYARKNSEATSEANHALRLLKGHYPQYPVYYDLEDSSIKTATKSNKSKITGFAKIFCSKLDNNGYKSGVYASLSWFNSYIDKSKLAGYDMWVAQWPSKTSEYGNGSSYSIWQCSSSGSVHGIYGRVDINLLVKPYSTMEKFMTYDSFPSTLAISDVNYDRYINTDGVTLRKGPGLGFKPAGFTLNKRDRVAVTRTANGYSEVTDVDGNTSWVVSGYLVAPTTPFGFDEIEVEVQQEPSEEPGEEPEKVHVTKTVLKSYEDEILKDTIVNIGGYLYGTDAEGVKIVGKTAWSGYKCYIFDSQGRAYINKSKTKKKATIYANAGSGSKGSLKKGKSFYVMRTSGKYSQMANGLWVKTSYTKKTAVYPTYKPSVNKRYTTKMKKKAASYTGPSTSYIKKKTLKKNKKVTVVGTYGNWAKLTTGYWVPKSKLR